MSDDATYYNQMLWSYSDKLISSSNLNIDKFVVKDNWGISPLKLKISINHYKSKTVHNITLSHQDVYNFVYQFKKYEDKVNDMIKAIEVDPNVQYTFSIKNKKNLFITFLNRNEYSGLCIRLVISEKNSDYLDSEKIYIPLFDFLSMIMILGQYRNNYVSVSDSMINFVALKDLTNKFIEMDNKLSNYYSEFISRTKLNENNISLTTESLTTEYSPFDNKVEVIDESNKQNSSSTDKEFLHPLVSVIEATKEEILDIISIHDEMNQFIQDNRDGYDIGLDGSAVNDKTKPKIEHAVVIPSVFTEKMLLNDITNLEMYLMNLINDDLPFSKFSEIIKNKLLFNPLENISQEDINATDYLISIYLKTSIKENLDKKQEIPGSVPPIVFDDIVMNDNKISLAYDLYLYCIYYSHLRNVLKDKDYAIVANKELITFALKTISTPYVFSMIKNIEESILVSELINRYRKYKLLGVFNKVEKEILDNRSITINITEDTIKNEASRIYGIIKQKWNNLTIQGTFKERSCILKYDDFKKNLLSKEQIKKILDAEFSFNKNGKVDFKEAGIAGFNDIPLTISEKYGIKIQKFDNTNLKRFIKDKCKDNENLCKSCLEVADLINESYRDLKDKIVDYSMIPDDILKAIVLWDLKNDNKLVSSYIYLIEKVKESNLTKDMIVSMLLNISNKEDINFTKSFIAVREE